MKVQDVKQGLAIWALAILDSGATSISLRQHNDTQIAFYFDGLYCSSQRLLDGRLEGAEGPVAVPGEKFLAALGLCADEDDITLKVEGSELVFATTLVQLGMRVQEGQDLYLPDPEQGISLRVLRKPLTDILDFMGQIASKKLHTAVLTGVNIRLVKGTTIVISATDNQGRAGVATYKPELVENPEDFNVVMPVADLRAALSMLDEVITITRRGTRICLADERTQAHLAPIAGTFPNLKALPVKFEQMITLPTSAIATAAKAAGILDADKVARIVVQKGRAAITVAGREVGRFALNLGDQSVADMSIAFDAEFLAAAQSLAEKNVRFHYNKANAPTMFEGEKSAARYWLSPIIVK